MERPLKGLSEMRYSEYLELGPDPKKPTLRGSRINTSLLSFSLKVESLRDEHPEVRKRLGSFESDAKRHARSLKISVLFYIFVSLSFNPHSGPITHSDYISLYDHYFRAVTKFEFRIGFFF